MVTIVTHHSDAEDTYTNNQQAQRTPLSSELNSNVVCNMKHVSLLATKRVGSPDLIKLCNNNQDSCPCNTNTNTFLQNNTIIVIQ